MATFAEPIRPYHFLLSEANGTLSREKVTIASGSSPAVPGTVLGKITASGKYTAYDDGLSNGAQTAVAILTHEVDTTSDVVAQVILRLAEVKKDALSWHASADATAKTKAYSDLVTSNIAVRD